MKKIKKLVGLKKTDFDLYIKNHEGILPVQIHVRLTSNYTNDIRKGYNL